MDVNDRKADRALLVATWGLPSGWSCVRYIPPKFSDHELCKKPTEFEYSEHGGYYFSSTSAIYYELNRAGLDVKVVIIGQDTLVARCGGKPRPEQRQCCCDDEQCCCKGDDKKRVVDEKYCSDNEKLFEEIQRGKTVSYADLRGRAEKVLRDYAGAYLGDDAHVDVIVLPGIGYYNGYVFDSPLENAKFVLAKELYDKLRNYKPDVVVLDITHGLNYIPAMTYSTIATLTKALYVVKERPRCVYILNSDPVTQQSQCKDVRLNVVEVVDMKKEEITIKDMLREIGEFNTASVNIQTSDKRRGKEPDEELLNIIPKELLNIISDVRKNDKKLNELSQSYVKCLGNALEYGMMLYVAVKLSDKNFDNFVNYAKNQVDRLYEFINKNVFIKYNNNTVVVSRPYAVNSDVMFQYVVSDILSHLKHEIMKCRDDTGVNGYDLVCLSEFVESIKVSKPVYVLFDHEAKKIMEISTKHPNIIVDVPKLLCEVYNEAEPVRCRRECKRCSPNQRDLIAHAGLEMTVTEVYKKANRVFVKYVEDDAERGPIPACIENHVC
jgi:CRISPR-associated protein Csx1